MLVYPKVSTASGVVWQSRVFSNKETSPERGERIKHIPVCRKKSELSRRSVGETGK